MIKTKIYREKYNSKKFENFTILTKNIFSNFTTHFNKKFRWRFSVKLLYSIDKFLTKILQNYHKN